MYDLVRAVLRRDLGALRLQEVARHVRAPRRREEADGALVLGLGPPRGGREIDFSGTRPHGGV